jgi:hypothetical protein
MVGISISRGNGLHVIIASVDMQGTSLNTLPSDNAQVIVLCMAKDKGSNKRDRQITIRVSDGDLTLFKQAAAEAWPGAILSTASVMLSLARLQADQILSQTSARKRR